MRVCGWSVGTRRPWRQRCRRETLGWTDTTHGAVWLPWWRTWRWGHRRRPHSTAGRRGSSSGRADLGQARLGLGAGCALGSGAVCPPHARPSCGCIARGRGSPRRGNALPLCPASLPSAHFTRALRHLAPSASRFTALLSAGSRPLMRSSSARSPAQPLPYAAFEWNDTVVARRSTRCAAKRLQRAGGRICGAVPGGSGRAVTLPREVHPAPSRAQRRLVRAAHAVTSPYMGRTAQDKRLHRPPTRTRI